MGLKKKIKYRLKKNTVFLGLIKKYRTHEFNTTVSLHTQKPKKVQFSFFVKHFIFLLNIFYIFDLIKAWKYIDSEYSNNFPLLNYYASIGASNFSEFLNKKIHDVTIRKNNMVVFSRPKKQVFLMIYKSQPIFIFTGGLMRIVMNEKRKSSKKLYKVAISLIKLSTILVSKKNYFNRGYLKLVNTGLLNAKILQAFNKLSKPTKILYVLIYFRTDFTAQKLETRRSIKKYVKKRFKI
jgi:hypothetical protein